MRKYIVFALLLLLLPTVVAAQFVLTATPAGNRAWDFTVCYTPADGAQTALQFDLLLPPGLVLADEPAPVGPAGCVMQWAPQSGGALRVVLYVTGSTTFGTAGRAVFTCRLTAADGLSAGDYDISLTGGRAATAVGREYVLDEARCTVSVLPPAPAVYRLTWLIDGETFATDSVAEGTPLVPPVIAEREGYTFSGWQELSEVMPGSDLTVTATWTVNVYRLLYYLDDALYASFEVPYGAPLQLLPAPDCEGLFEGWSELPATMPAHDVTVRGTTSTTGIGISVAPHRPVPVFTLGGRLVGADSAALRRSLPAGVYVVAGRKVVFGPH